MSRFYAQIQGNHGIASRQGHKSSGIWSHIRGWNLGIEVQGFVDSQGKDVFWVSITKGSNNTGDKALALIVSENGQSIKATVNTEELQIIDAIAVEEAS